MSARGRPRTRAKSAAASGSILLASLAKMRLEKITRRLLVSKIFIVIIRDAGNTYL